MVAKELAVVAESSPLLHVASDHLLSLIDVELAWLDRSLAYLRDAHWVETPGEPPAHSTEESPSGS
jgi:hypothetical protein